MRHPKRRAFTWRSTNVKARYSGGAFISSTAVPYQSGLRRSSRVCSATIDPADVRGRNGCGRSVDGVATGIKRVYQTTATNDHASPAVHKVSLLYLWVVHKALVVRAAAGEQREALFVRSSCSLSLKRVRYSGRHHAVPSPPR